MYYVQPTRRVGSTFCFPALSIPDSRTTNLIPQLLMCIYRLFQVLSYLLATSCAKLARGDLLSPSAGFALARSHRLQNQLLVGFGSSSVQRLPFSGIQAARTLTERIGTMGAAR
jgi:hypothetical protein